MSDTPIKTLLDLLFRGRNRDPSPAEWNDGSIRKVADPSVSKLDSETNELLSLDLIVGRGLEKVWDGRVIVAWRKRNVSIVSRPGLVAMKRLAGRPQDLADIAILEGTDEDDQE